MYFKAHALTRQTPAVPANNNTLTKKGFPYPQSRLIIVLRFY